MKYYKMYMDRQGISPEVHEKLLNLEAPKRRPVWTRYGTLAACAALIIGLGVWRLAPEAAPAEDTQNACQFVPDYDSQPCEKSAAAEDLSPAPNPNGAVKDEYKQALDRGTEEAVSRGEPQDNLMADISATPLWEGETFASLAEARQEEAFAPYLPASEPEGYSAFSGTLSYGTLSVFWSRGYDNIQVSVRLPGSRSCNLADPSRPETYDLSLYPIPWCDSVPDELREVVSDPAFRAEDMTLSIVEARGHGHDTGGMTYSFSVLHSDGTLVSYRCDGMTAQQVWAMVEETL